ncbi:MAG: hypothetical protein Kow0059_11890 [Candidatus Sumerlaeia bacterium]
MCIPDDPSKQAAGHPATAAIGPAGGRTAGRNERSRHFIPPTPAVLRADVETQ